MSYQQNRSTTSGLEKNMQALRVSPPKVQSSPNGRRYYDINLVANYFAIELATSHSQNLYQYTIDVQPQPRTRRLRRRAIYCWLQSHNIGVNYVTNYHNFLVTSKRIDEIDDEGFKYWDEHETAPRQNHAPSCRITITFYKSFNIPSFLSQLSSNTVSDVDKNDMLVIMNMIFSQRMNEMSFRTPSQDLQVAAVASDKFFMITPPPPPVLLGGGRNHLRATLVAHSGFVRSARCPDRLLLNVNNATGTFYPEGPLSRLIDNYLGSADRWPRFDLSAFLKGLRVKTTHLRASNNRPEKIYTISCIARPEPPDNNRRPTPARIFFNLNGNLTSVGTYYQQRHGHTGVNNTSNCIVVQCGPNDNPIYLPSNVFQVLRGQPFKKLLSGSQTADMITHSCREPIANRDNITTAGLSLLGVRPALNDGPQARFGITLQQQMTRVTGRILFPPVVQYQQQVRENSLTTGGWNLFGRHFALAAPKATWTFLQIRYEEDENIIEHANLEWNALEFKKAMPTYGVRNHELFQFTGKDQTNHTLDMEGDLDAWDSARNDRNEVALRKSLQLIQSKKVRLVLITLPAKNTNLYAMVKRVADVSVGIHTICAVAGWQTHPDMVEKFWAIKWSAPFLGNLMLKYNLKLGGVNHRLNLSKQGIMRFSTMFVGMDVTHPSPGSQNGAPSIAAVVATEEPDIFVKWPASIRLQQPREEKKSRELIDDLQAMLIERLKHWKNKNKKLPEQIIIYRDGVSDGFYDLVREQEFAKMQAAIAEVFDGCANRPKIVFILVLKRHSTRFFPSPNGTGSDQDHVTNGSLLDARGNVKPGLLVEDTLTRWNERSYFLQSHEGLQGTARPVHYLVKVDAGHSPLGVMALTHDFCYLFSRATRSVHVHPAILHADLACGRARHYLRHVYSPPAPGNYDHAHWHQRNLYKPHANLQESMFYI